MTLRDGEQTPGVSFTTEEKMEIASRLDAVGVEVIEAGFPIVSEMEKEKVRKISRMGLDAKICGLSRACREDVDAAIDAEVDMIGLFIATSDIHLKYKHKKPLEEVLTKAMDQADYAIDHGLIVRFGAEDASRTDLTVLSDVYRQAGEHKASYVTYADTTGCLTPLEVERNIRELIPKSPPIAMHCHDDLGCATANTIIGAEIGAFQLHTTVNGIGERSGNTPLEEVLVILALKGGVTRYDLTEINLKADAVFFWDYSKNLEKMEEANIPVVVTQLSSPEREPTSITAFKDTIKDEVKLFGTVLGSDATKRADDYCTYFDEKTDKVLSVTSKIPDKDRVKVYYIAGDDTLTTYGKNTYTQWWVEMAGGKLVSADIDDQAPQVSIEQVISWNPDYIMMGRVNSTDMVLHDSKWNDLKAVKEGHVYVCPQGVFYWDYSSEGILLMEYLAKTFYPEKFADLDMTEEVKEYYKKFYNYSLTDDQADLILKHLPPTKE